MAKRRYRDTLDARSEGSREERKARQLGGLRRGHLAPGSSALNPGKPYIPDGEPRLTPALAYEFVKLLHAGIPQLTAMAYLAPEYDRTASKNVRAGWRRRWMNDPLLLDAATKLNGGDWPALDADRRLEIALDKHYAELAYFLYTHDYADLLDVDLQKANVAREALSAKLSQDSEAGQETPWMRAMRDLLEGKVTGMAPPQLDVIPVDTVKES